MIYLVDPQTKQDPRCTFVCSTYCGIKPLYGIDI